jgi:hypothetical protein
MGDGDPKIEGFHGKDDDQMNSKGELLFREIRGISLSQMFKGVRCKWMFRGSFWGMSSTRTWVRRSFFVILLRFPGANICGPLYSLN